MVAVKFCWSPDHSPASVSPSLSVAFSSLNLFLGGGGGSVGVSWIRLDEITYPANGLTHRVPARNNDETRRDLLPNTPLVSQRNQTPQTHSWGLVWYYLSCSSWWCDRSFFFLWTRKFMQGGRINRCCCGLRQQEQQQQQRGGGDVVQETGIQVVLHHVRLTS